MPKDWAEELNRLALQDHKNSAPSLTACVEEKKKKISSLSEKLERLLTGYLDQVIDQPDYCLQKAKLLSEKKSLEEEIFNFSHKQNDWLAPFQNWLKDAQSLDKIASDFAPASWRKNSPSRRRRESEFIGEFIGENERNSVGVPTARPLLGWFSTAKFHSGARDRTCTCTGLLPYAPQAYAYTKFRHPGKLVYDHGLL